MNDIIKTLQFEKEQLEARIRLLEDKVESDKRQISEYDAELREAKRLLKEAVEDFEYIKPYTSRCDGHCNNCPFENEGWCRIDWRYADEALKLIGGEADD